jgi:glycerophosphoryl diester phosphodiesterase
MKAQPFDVQGHRGCRGLLPENTVAAFLKALDLGVSTLELDLTVSGDKQVVVSHEPYFSSELTTLPNGDHITEKEEQRYNLYTMDYQQIASFDVGLKFHSRFPDQQKVKAVKPLFSRVVTKADRHASGTNRPLPWYNIEIKRRPEWDERFHPGVNEFVRLVLQAVEDNGISDRVYIQSFDPQTLQLCREMNSQIPLVLLVENELGFEQNIKELGFLPEVYSPYYKLVDAKLLAQCSERQIQLIPWTVNEPDEIEKLLELGVDGMISDYPDRLLKAVRAKGGQVK